MKEIYNLSELSIMSGFTTRTLRNYLNRGILKGKKVDGAWQFSAKEVGEFFEEPFVKEGFSIKMNSLVFDFLAERKKTESRTCVILDVPSSVLKGNEISAFFCDRMNGSSDVEFKFSWSRGCGRVILSGADDQVAKIMKAYYELGE